MRVEPLARLVPLNSLNNFSREKVSVNSHWYKDDEEEGHRA